MNPIGPNVHAGIARAIAVGRGQPHGPAWKPGPPNSLEMSVVSDA